jgi:hypothetical protein
VSGAALDALGTGALHLPDGGSTTPPATYRSQVATLKAGRAPAPEDRPCPIMPNACRPRRPDHRRLTRHRPRHRRTKRARGRRNRIATARMPTGRRRAAPYIRANNADDITSGDGRGGDDAAMVVRFAGSTSGQQCRFQTETPGADFDADRFR